jgi:hypothetical protein
MNKISCIYLQSVHLIKIQRFNLKLKLQDSCTEFLLEEIKVKSILLDFQRIIKK